MKRNAYFRLVKDGTGYGVKFFPPLEGGEEIRLQELINYLDGNGCNYDLTQLKEAVAKKEEIVFHLGDGECPKVRETYFLTISEDYMNAFARFIPCSETSERMTKEGFKHEIAARGVKSGVLDQVLDQHFGTAGYYCTNILVAKGQPPRHGTDAHIEYYFETDNNAKPEMKEDGTVDYFNLNIVKPVKAGQELARIIPEDPGEYGMNILGSPIKPRDVKKVRLEFGKNITLSPDRMSITSDVSGHVMLIGGQVFVSNTYEVENVDTATGNIDFDGCVQVNGNVATNYVVKATGDVIVKGVVEGAVVEAGGNIVIARGMNGMSRGVLKAGGNVIAKFLENATVEAEGYVNTESILHCNVSSGSEITVTGKHGFITGGHVQADSKVEVRTLGATMGASTIVEVGVNPKIKNEYLQLQKEIAGIVAAIKNAQPTITNFMEKKAKGVRFTEDQLKYVRETAAALEANKVLLEQKSQRSKELSEMVDVGKRAEVHVTGEVYPGTTIVIGDVSMNVQQSFRYCKFARVDGEVKMLPL